ncbi:hypothetical protein GCM10011577_12870 [Pseudarthrobacter polychromogenes]|uniref:Uncharacterized protein n=1 Tax=Pseudarthrobacter polychromogenes TaxID=1676 RepID=A0ABQ1XGL1_9MICC|nr:hypothetical protein GCM10011577_12870 [Pseudarthrobacter polychromogenes]
MLRVLVTAAEAAAALPLTNEPGKRNEFWSQVCRNLNGHSDYLWKSASSGKRRLLLALEEAVDHESGKPGHGEAGDAEQDKEEDFKSKYGHDAILTR